MNIAGLDKAEVLAALYNNARQQGMGFLQTRGAEGMTVEQAREEIANNKRMYFDYLHGRVMKISLRGDELETALYNRDNGQGTAESIIAALRPNAKVNGGAAAELQNGDKHNG
jgi:hypothetical protein